MKPSRFIRNKLPVVFLGQHLHRDHINAEGQRHKSRVGGNDSKENPVKHPQLPEENRSEEIKEQHAEAFIHPDKNQPPPNVR